MYDYIIIGGGIAGASAASTLATLGSVLVLEAESNFGTHASGRSAAVFLEHYGNDTIKALNSASLASLKTMDVLKPRGVLMVGHAQDRAGFDTGLAQMKMTEVSLQDAFAKLPILNLNRVTMAAYSSDALDMDTDFMLQHYLSDARSLGAVTMTHQKVTGIVRDSKGWRIDTPDETFFATNVVNAAGAWADEVAQLAGCVPLGITPKRRSMAQLPAPVGHETDIWPLTIGASGDWYAKPSAGKWYASTEDEEATFPHDAWADDMVIAEGLARYEAMVTSPVTRVETTWAGLRSFSPDGSLVIGPDPDDAQFLWCAGQGGYGFQTAPAAARLLAELSNGRVPELAADVVKRLTPARYH